MIIIINTKKSFEKKHTKDIKVFLKKINKEKKRKKAHKKYQNLFEQEKEKKRQYHHERNNNLSEEQKQKLVEYMKNYYLAHKITF